MSFLFELAAGEPPPEADRMDALFRCAQVQEQLFLLIGLRAQEISRRHPQVARHLGWCHGCRGRLVQVLRVEEAASRGEFGPLLCPTPARWKETVGSVGERIRELVGRAIIRVQEGAAVLTAVPDGLTVVPALAAARRGTFPSESASGIEAQQVTLGLAESALSADLTLHVPNPQRLGIALRIMGAQGEEPLTVSLRAVHAENTELVAAHTVRGEDPVALGNLPPGDYILEIHEKSHNVRFRVVFTIEAS
jgi:hypothetical protein